jgi:hypothetical protein
MDNVTGLVKAEAVCRNTAFANTAMKAMFNRFGIFRLGRTFLLIWLGQLVSSFGVSMMRFAYFMSVAAISFSLTVIGWSG